MGQVFFANLTGANCHLSGQAIVSLQVSEDADADYDTASVVTIAPGGLFGAGSTLETIEGGVSTGFWEVEDPVQSVSGEKTWRRRQGAAGYAHIPLASYKLRRKGYMAARCTLSKEVVGASNYPPKFMESGAYNRYSWDNYRQWQNGSLDGFEMRKLNGSWRVVASAGQIIAAICGWVGLSYRLRTNLGNVAEEYIPVDKPAIQAIREVASWSGASVMLDRSGTLQIFNWEEIYGRGGSNPALRAVTEMEAHYGLASLNHVSVVGTTYSPKDSRPGVIYYQERRQYPLEVTESLPLAGGERIVSERIEVSYPLTPNAARSMARERLARAYLQANVSRWVGPAEGAQSMRPLENRVLSVNRSLTWNGRAYRYEISVTAARGAVPFSGSGSSVGGWW